MLIKNLINCELKKAIKEKTATGSLVVSDYELIDNYRVQKDTLQDIITTTMYGSDVNKMLRIASPLHDLEAYLLPKVDNKEDNISMYYIYIDDVQYKVVAVREYYVDIKRL